MLDAEKSKSGKSKMVDVSKLKEQMTEKSIDEYAKDIKNMHDAFRKAGFNESQAFELVKVQLSILKINR